MVHVDNVLIAGQGPTFDAAAQRLEAKIPFREWAVGEGEYCGSVLFQDPETIDITIRQTTPYQELKQVTLCRRVADNEPATDAEVVRLRRLLGQGGWLCSQTRPGTSVRYSKVNRCFLDPRWAKFGAPTLWLGVYSNSRTCP